MHTTDFVSKQICNYSLHKNAETIQHVKELMKKHKTELQQQKEHHEAQLLTANAILQECRQQQVKTEEQRQADIANEKQNCQPGCL